LVVTEVKQTEIEVSHREHGEHGGLSPCSLCPLWEIMIKEKVNAGILGLTGDMSLLYPFQI
jgi:hypothetical protein